MASRTPARGYRVACEFGPSSSEADKENVQRIVQDDSASELIHANHAFLCARVKLDGEYAIDDPECEKCLANAIVATDRWRDAWMKDRKAVCIDTFFDEDVFIPALPAERKRWMEIALKGLESDLKVKRPTQQRPAVTEENIQYFQKRNLAREDAECCVWALSFYTGEGSKSASRAGSLCIRKGNMVKVDVDPAAQMLVEQTRPVLYFLVRALQHLPYRWGVVIRFLTLSEADQHLYKPGHIVTWTQFSSSSKSKEGSGHFSTRNTKVIIYSQKGRYIDQFSNYSKRIDSSNDEEEVLFLPFTRLLVLETRNEPGDDGEMQLVIRCRELELGISQMVDGQPRGLPLLWVDDNIHDEDFEMKELMQRAQIQHRQEIKFILKRSTE